MILAGLLIRLILIVPGHRILLNPAEDHFRFGWEMGRVARSLASGQGFSSPYGAETGPTGVLPPVYPYLLAGVFRIFGVYTDASAYVILALNSVFSTLNCWYVFWIARETFGETVAIWSGWTWAFFYPAIFFSVRVVWETTLSALLLSIVVLLALRLNPFASAWRWLAFGVISGFGTLNNPAIVSVLPILLLSCWFRNRDGVSRFLRSISLWAIAFTLTMTPWIARNYVVFHRIIPFRTNFGLELQIGNNPRATGIQLKDLHPSSNTRELETYERLGEMEYMREKKLEALQFIGTHPGDFISLTFKRVGLWWVAGWETSGSTPFTQIFGMAELLGYSLFSGLAFIGLALWIRAGKLEALPFAGLMILYPLVYYVTVVHARLRHPIEPFMLILAVYVLHRAFSWEKNQSSFSEPPITAPVR